MKYPFILLALTMLALARADAVEFRAYKATVSLPFINGITLNDTDKFVNTRLSNKQLINLALGQSFKVKVAKELTVAILVPSAAGTPFPARLVVFNTKTKLVLRTVATFTATNVLVPDDPKKPAASLVSAAFPALANLEFDIDAFTLTGSGAGSSIVTPTAVSVAVKLGGLHGQFTRNHPTLFYYAGVVTAATIRATGKPIATINL